MNLNELLSELNARLENGRLTLTFDDSSPLMQGLYQLFFKVRIPLVLEGCTVTARPADAPAEITVEGRGVLIPERGESAQSPIMEIKLRLTEQDGSLFHQLEAKASGQFTLEALFGPIDPQYRAEDGGMTLYMSHLAGIIIENPIFTTQTGNETQELPFSLRGSLLLPKEWQKYTALLGGMPCTVTGTCSLFTRSGMGLPFRLEAGLSTQFKAVQARTTANGSFLEAAGLKFSLVNGAYNSQEVFDDSISTSEVHVTFRFRGIDTVINLTAPLFFNDAYWPLKASFSNGLGLGDVLTFFMSLFQLDSGSLLLPAESELNTMKLYGLYFGMEQENGRLELRDATAMLRTSRPWKLPFPGVTLENLSLRWCMQWGRGDGIDLLSGEVAGAITLALFGGKTLRLEAEAELPSLDLHATLKLEKDSKDYALGDVIGSEPLTALPGKPESGLVLAELEMEASYWQRSLSLYVQVNNALSFSLGNLGVTLEKIYARAHFTQGGNSYEIGGEIGFDAGDGFALSLSGSYASGNWEFHGRLSRGPLNLNALISAFFPQTQNDSLAMLPVVNITALDITYRYESQSSQSAFSISTTLTVDWGKIMGITVRSGAALLLESNKQGDNFISVMLQLDIAPLSIAVQADNFHTDNPAYYFLLQYNKSVLRASYAVKKVKDETGKEENHQILSVKLENIRLSDIISWLVRLVNPNAGFTLPAPWNTLLGLDLSHFYLETDLTAKTVQFAYALNLSIPGILTIKGVGAEYAYGKNDGGIKLIVDTGDDGKLKWDPIREKPPSVAENPKYFHLTYLGLGQHFTTNDIQTADSVSEAIAALKATFRPETQDALRYDSQSNWLFGADFTVNEALHVSLVLNDPSFYGILVEVYSENAPFAMFKGLMLELLYQKVTKDIGMFRATLQVPERMRKLDLGGIILYLGVFRMEIYTNGDFLIDLGFPAGGDFSNSFGFQYGLLTGKGGFLFGILSGATCPKLPRPVIGAFTSVLQIGVGVCAGISHSFNFGIVGGGMTLTFIGIFDGLFAIYDPGDNKDKSLYYKISAMVGIVGRIFVKVNLYIISLEASAELSAYAMLTLEAYRAAQVKLNVHLSLSAKIRILFIKINISFDFSHQFQFTLGSDSTAPWEKSTNRLRAVVSDVFTPVALPEGMHEAEIKVSMLFSCANENYCAAFIPVMTLEDISTLIDLLARWVLFPFGEYPGQELPESLNEDILKSRVDYACLSKLLEQNLRLRLGTFQTDEDNELQGYAVPMPPQAELTLSKQGETEPLYHANYWLDNLIPPDYAERLRIYFEMFSTLPDQVKRTKDGGENRPMSELVFTDIMHLILRGLMNQAKGFYQQIELSAIELNFTNIETEFGLTPMAVLTQNLDLLLAAGTLTVPVQTIHAGGEETLIMTAERVGCEAGALYEDNSSASSLLRQGVNWMLVGHTFENPTNLEPAIAAGLFFIRHGGFSDESFYHLYVEALFEQVTGGMNWMEGAETTKTTLELPGHGKWICLPGDTVENLSRLCALLDGKLDDRAAWQTYRANFLTQNAGWVSGALHIPEQQITVNGDIDLSGLYYRIFAESGAAHRELLLCQPILRQNGKLVARGVNLVLEQAVTIKQVLSQYGLAPEELAATLGGIAHPFSPDVKIRLERPERIPKAILLNRLQNPDNLTTLASAASRFLLQGLRLPLADGTAETVSFYEALGQQIPFDASVSGDWTLTLDSGSRTPWLTGNSTQTLTTEQVNKQLPDLNYDWRNTIHLKGELPLFTTLRRSYALSSGLVWAKTVEGGAYQHAFAVHPFSKALQTDAPYLKQPILYWNGDSVETVGFGLLLPIGVHLAEGVLSVEGADPTDRLLLEGLLQDDAPNYVLLSSPPVTDGLLGILTELPIKGNNLLIQSNLSRETHMFPQNRRASDLEHTAQYGTKTFLRLLWQCSTVGGGGYHLCMEQLPDLSSFDEDGRGKLWLLAMRGSPQQANCVVLSETLPAIRGETIILREETDLPDERFNEIQPLLPPGAYGVRLTAPPSEDDSQSLMSILGYRVGNAPYQTMAGKDSKPLLPRELGEEVAYDVIIPLYRALGENPYLALGKTAELNIYCRDVLGNPASQLQTTRITPTINDFLIGVHEWAGISLSWALSGEKGLNLLLYLDCMDKLDNDVETDVERLRRALWQMEQAVEIRITTTGFLKDIILSSAQRDSLHNYGMQLYQHLSQGATRPVALCLSLPAITVEQPATYHQLKVLLTFTRAGGMELPEEATTVSSLVEPRVAADDSGALASFAKVFEQTLPSYKLAQSGGTNRSLYAVFTGECGMIPSIKISPYNNLYNSVTAPAFYAFRPLMNRPVSRTVCVPQYDGNWSYTGESEPQLFLDFDIDALVMQLFEDMERCLETRFATTLSGFPQPKLEQLLNAKEILAARMAATLLPLAQNGQGTGLEHAQHLVLDRLRKNLAQGTRLSAVAEYHVEARNTGVRLTAVATPGTGQDSSMTVHAAKLDLNQDALFLLIEFKSPFQAGGILNTELTLQDIEYDILCGEGGYESSKWLRLLRPISAFTDPLLLSTDLSSQLLAPNPLRRLPKSLRLESQQSRPGKDLLYQWEHVVHCTGWTVEQDEHTLELCYQESVAMKNGEPEDLAWAICRYSALRDQLLAAIFDVGNPNAFAAFTELVEQIALHWNSSVTLPRQGAIKGTTCMVRYKVEQEKMVLSNTPTPWTASVETGAAGVDGTLAFDLTIAGLSLYKEHMALTKAYTTRNHNLLTFTQGITKLPPSVDEGFVYRTQPVSLPPLYATASLDGEILRIGGIHGSVSTETVTRALHLLGEILGLEGITNPAEIIVWAGYAINSNGPMVRLPLALFPALDSGTIVGNRVIIDTICDWFEKKKPGWKSFSLVFGVRIFAPNGFRTLFHAGGLEVYFTE